MLIERISTLILKLAWGTLFPFKKNIPCPKNLMPIILGFAEELKKFVIWERQYNEREPVWDEIQSKILIWRFDEEHISLRKANRQIINFFSFREGG